MFECLNLISTPEEINKNFINIVSVTKDLCSLNAIREVNKKYIDDLAQ